jgi:hypothetical protein
MPYYNYEPTISVREIQYKLNCDRSIMAKGTILTNRPDTVTLHKTIEEA